MNKFNSLKCAAVLLPALAMGIPMANANDKDCDCPCETDRSTAMLGSDRQHQRDDQRQDQRSDQRQDQRAGQQSATDRTASSTAAAASARSARAGQTDSNQYVENKPERGFHSDSLVGQEVKSRSNNESVGTVSNLLLDHDGQVVAVVIGVGGLMGIGQRDVAISWDQVERRTEGDETTLWVNLTEESLNDAPQYSSDRKDSTDRTTSRR